MRSSDSRRTEHGNDHGHRDHGKNRLSSSSRRRPHNSSIAHLVAKTGVVHSWPSGGNRLKADTIHSDHQLVEIAGVLTASGNTHAHSGRFENVHGHTSTRHYNLVTPKHCIHRIHLAETQHFLPRNDVQPHLGFPASDSCRCKHAPRMYFHRMASKLKWSQTLGNSKSAWMMRHPFAYRIHRPDPEKPIVILLPTQAAAHCLPDDQKRPALARHPLAIPFLIPPTIWGSKNSDRSVSTIRASERSG